MLLPSKMIARAEAARAAVDMVRATGRPGAIAVRDEEGEPLFEVHALCRCESPQRLGVASFTCTRTRAECGHASEVAARAEAA